MEMWNKKKTLHSVAARSSHPAPTNANPSLPEGDALALRSDATRFRRFPPDRPRNSALLPAPARGGESNAPRSFAATVFRIAARADAASPTRSEAPPATRASASSAAAAEVSRATAREPLANRGGTSATASDAMPVLTCLTSRFRSVRRPTPSASSASSSPAKASAGVAAVAGTVVAPRVARHRAPVVVRLRERVACLSIGLGSGKQTRVRDAGHALRVQGAGDIRADVGAEAVRLFQAQLGLARPPFVAFRALSLRARASPSAAMADAERGGVLNTARSATSRPCSTSLSDSTIERFCTFVGARNVPQWRRAASFSSFLFRLFCAARFASARCSLGVDASPLALAQDHVRGIARAAREPRRGAPAGERALRRGGGCRSSNCALADTPRISSAGVSFATTSVGPNFRWVACAWSGPATASCATSSTALRVEARDERRCEGPGGFIVLRGRRGRGVSCQRARRNTRHTGSTDRMS